MKNQKANSTVSHVSPVSTKIEDYPNALMWKQAFDEAYEKMGGEGPRVDVVVSPEFKALNLELEYDRKNSDDYRSNPVGGEANNLYSGMTPLEFFKYFDESSESWFSVMVEGPFDPTPDEKTDTWVSIAIGSPSGYRHTTKIVKNDEQRAIKIANRLVAIEEAFGVEKALKYAKDLGGFDEYTVEGACEVFDKIFSA